MNYIKSINWILTYRCNLKCRHCDIWTNPYKNTVDIKKLESIMSSPILIKSKEHFGDDFDIAITGGEPFLVKNLHDIIDMIERILPDSFHTITTNGTLEKELLDFLEYRKKSGKGLKKLNISIDGLADVHDYQRGIVGSFEKTLRTILRVRKDFPEQFIEIKLTVTKDNIDSILPFMKLAHKLGVYFSFKPAENMASYTNQTHSPHESFSEDEIMRIQSQIIENPYIKHQEYYISPSFFEAIPGYLRHGLDNKEQCNVAQDSITIMPDLKVYSCILMELIGTLDTQTLDEVWQSDSLSKMRKQILAGKCPGCMLMCGSFKTNKLFHA